MADNPLSAFYRGFQGAQRTAQTQQQQAVENELARELRVIQQAQLQKQITEANRPLNERILEAVLLGAAQRGEILPGQATTTATSTIPAMAAQQAALGGAVGIPQDLQAPGLNEALSQITAPPQIPGIPEGFTFNPEASTQRAIRLAESRRTAVPPGFVTITGEDGQIYRVPKIGEQIAQPLTGPTGESIKAPPKATRGGLSENARLSYLSRASKAGVDLNDPRFLDASGNQDFTKIAVEAGRAEREIADAARDAKLKQTDLPAEAKNKVKAYFAVQKDLESLRTKLDDISQSGDIPSGFQDVISSSLSDAPTTFFGRAFQRFALQPLQSKNAAELSRLKGAVTSAVGRAIAGASLTGTELTNIRQFTPTQEDSFERVLEKSAGLESFINNQISGLTTPISGAAPVEAVPAATTAPLKIGRFTVTPK